MSPDGGGSSLRLEQLLAERRGDLVVPLVQRPAVFVDEEKDHGGFGQSPEDCGGVLLGHPVAKGLHTGQALNGATDALSMPAHALRIHGVESGSVPVKAMGEGSSKLMFGLVGFLVWLLFLVVVGLRIWRER